MKPGNSNIKIENGEYYYIHNKHLCNYESLCKDTKERWSNNTGASKCTTGERIVPKRSYTQWKGNYIILTNMAFLDTPRNSNHYYWRHSGECVEHQIYHERNIE